MHEAEKDREFALGQAVIVTDSGERGTVYGRTEPNDGVAYFVRMESGEKRLLADAALKAEEGEMTKDTGTRKFKVGDRVRCVDDDSSGPVGLVGIVHKTADSNGTGCWGFECDVVFPGFGRGHDGVDNDGTSEHWFADHKNLRPAEDIVKPEAPAIVARTDRGPAPRPVVHADRASAIAEAERLARANPGAEFAVYERVTARVADVTVREVA